jgi:fused signal recognition particle receptor
LQLGLLESDVAQEVIDDFSAKLKKELLGLKLEKDQNAEELIRSKFQTVITEMFAKTGKVDLINKIKVKRELNSGPFVVLFLGINGTGKTTTVAKVANLLRKNGISVVLAAADTHLIFGSLYCYHQSMLLFCIRLFLTEKVSLH